MIFKDFSRLFVLKIVEQIRLKKTVIKSEIIYNQQFVPPTAITY